MIKVYAIALVVGIIGLLAVVLGGALAENIGREDPTERWGFKGKAVVASAVGFGMGGISAEFSPIDFSWPLSLLIASGAAILSVLWARYSVRRSRA